MRCNFAQAVCNLCFHVFPIYTFHLAHNFYHTNHIEVLSATYYISSFHQENCRLIQRWTWQSTTRGLQFCNPLYFFIKINV